MWIGIIVASIAFYLLLGVVAAYPMLISEDPYDQKVGGIGVFLWPSLLVVAVLYWWFVWRPHRKWKKSRDK